MSVTKLKKIVGDEFAQYFDSHQHLAGQFKYHRPVIVDMAMKKGEDGHPVMRIVEENLQLISAHANETSILILDQKAFNPNQTYAANVIYIVVPGWELGKTDFDLCVEHEVGMKFSKVFRRVGSIEKALEHIAEQLAAIAEKVPTKIDNVVSYLENKPALWVRDTERRLTDIHVAVKDTLFTDPEWAYMAAKEIRIIGDFQHSAIGIPYSTAAVNWFINTSGKERMFNMKIVGAAKYHYSAIAGLLFMAAQMINNGYEISTKEKNFATGKEIYTYAKDRHGNYATRELPNSEEDILILPLSTWEKAKDKITLSPTYILAEQEQAAVFITTLQMEHQDVFVRFVQNYNDAIDHIKLFEQLENVQDTFPVQAIRLHKAKKIHLFLDVMDDAH